MNNIFFKKIVLSYSLGCYLLVDKIQNLQQDDMTQILQLFSMCIAFSLAQLLFPASIDQQTGSAEIVTSISRDTEVLDIG